MTKRSSKSELALILEIELESLYRKCIRLLDLNILFSESLFSQFRLNIRFAVFQLKSDLKSIA